MKGYGFTLVEILLVVIILGILAAIVVPQYSAASEETKISNLISDVQNVRSQILLYRNQHNGQLPTASGLSFEDAMTKYTKADGTLTETQQPGNGVFGSYLEQMPSNPFISDDKASKVNCGETTSTADCNSGWFFNTQTGVFIANDNAGHSAL